MSSVMSAVVGAPAQAAGPSATKQGGRAKEAGAGDFAPLLARAMAPPPGANPRAAEAPPAGTLEGEPVETAEG